MNQYFDKTKENVWNNSKQMKCPNKNDLYNQYIAKYPDYIKRITKIEEQMNIRFSGEEKTFCDYLRENISKSDISKRNPELHSTCWFYNNKDSFDFASPEVIKLMWTDFKQTIAWLDQLEKDFQVVTKIEQYP